MTQTISKPEIQKAVKPAPRWRNKWRFDVEVRWADGIDPAGESWGELVWPSYETAEQGAIDYLAFCSERPHPDDSDLTGLIHWLGAFPIEGDK